MTLLEMLCYEMPMLEMKLSHTINYTIHKQVYSRSSNRAGTSFLIVIRSMPLAKGILEYEHPFWKILLIVVDGVGGYGEGLEK